jgi:hypothetical protein
VIENIRSLNLIKAFSLFLLTGLHLGLFLNLSYQIKLTWFLDAKMTFGIILLILLILPILISKIVYKSFGSGKKKNTFAIGNKDDAFQSDFSCQTWYGSRGGEIIFSDIQESIDKTSATITYKNHKYTLQTPVL